MYRIYLLFASGLSAGESFLNWEEVEQWAYDQLGKWPDFTAKRAMRKGEPFRIGNRFYRCEKRLTHSMAAAA